MLNTTIHKQTQTTQARHDSLLQTTEGKDEPEHRFNIVDIVLGLCFKRDNVKCNRLTYRLINRIDLLHPTSK